MIPPIPPAWFREFDFLNCCYMAVTEADSGDAAAADEAYLEAWAVIGLLGSPPAASVILAAASPAQRGGRAALANALDAASLAALYAMDGTPVGAEIRTRDALAAAALLEPALRDALTVLLPLPVLPEGVQA
jgi:hypothetical protein